MPQELATQEAKRRSTARWVMLAAIAIVVGLGIEAALRFIRKGDVGDYPHWYYAAKAVIEGQNLYTQHWHWYNYMPMFAVLQTVFVPLGMNWGGAAWTVCNTVLILAGLWFGADEVLRRLRGRGDALTRALVFAVPVLLLGDKMRAELRMGQSDAIIFLSFVLALRWLDRRPWASGCLLGFIANFKFQSLVMLPYLLVRRRWVAAGVFVLAAVGLALGGSLIWGWERNCEYLRMEFGSLAGMLGAAERDLSGPLPNEMNWELSVSAPSALARLAGSMGWNAGKVAVAGTGLIAAAVAGVGWWMYLRRGQSLFEGRGVPADERGSGPTLTMLEWTGLIMGELAFSPQTPVRHLFLMILVVQIGTGLAVNLGPSRQRSALLAAMAVFWLGLILPPGSMHDATNAWRAVGGQVIVSLVLYFTVLWAGLGWAKQSHAEAQRRGGMQGQKSLNDG